MNTNRTASEAQLVDVKELGMMLGRSRSWIYRRIDSGHIPAPMRLGSSPVWQRRDIETWIDSGFPRSA